MLNENHKVLKYLKQVALVEGEQFKQDNSQNINPLAWHYDHLQVNRQSFLNSFLTGTLQENYKHNKVSAVFPFGFNLSQKEAVDKALQHSFSRIEGPAGAGKTTTLLNIMANLVMTGQTVAVVTNNTKATETIFHKLKHHNLGFMVAPLTSNAYGETVLSPNQKLPNLSTWHLKETKNLVDQLDSLALQLEEKLLLQNRVAMMKEELNVVSLEYQHFLKEQGHHIPNSYISKSNSESALKLWHYVQEKGSKVPWFGVRLVNSLRFGLSTDKTFYTLASNEKVKLSQVQFFVTKIAELTSTMDQLQQELNLFNLDQQLVLYCDLSLKLFQNYLANHYVNGRRPFELMDLNRNAVKFLSAFPVVCTTTYALRNCLQKGVLYDYLLIDEAAEVDLLKGVLALACAKNVVVLGDLNQLPFKVSKETDNFFNQFNIEKAYCYSSQSLLLSLTMLFPKAPKTVLQEHYRCHPYLMGFCNKKFYRQFMVLLSANNEKNPFKVHYVKSAHKEGVSAIQQKMDVIKREVLPHYTVSQQSRMVIISPCFNQDKFVQQTFNNKPFLAGTVNRFQGQEYDYVVLVPGFNGFDSNGLNVALSRAKKELILVVDSNDLTLDSNLVDIVNSIKYYQGVYGGLYSVYTYLYQAYENFTKNNNEVYNLVQKILNQADFNRFLVVANVPLWQITGHASNNIESTELTIDFLIYEQFGRQPVLALGVNNADNALKQAIFSQYHLPFMLFNPYQSDSQALLLAKLKETDSVKVL